MLYVCMHMNIHIRVWVPLEARKGCFFPKAVVTGGCVVLHMGTRNGTTVLWKSKMCFCFCFSFSDKVSLRWD